ncbi:tyrosine-type recombinase/integrase [Naasia lichenicola]|uniref:Site-specific integrase n=1 Tax=Naasia lichenicola TaxID=2565933 RepID=A0A4S4FLN4_9MICO|nr:tyrosine-type recombinase/integrase [Naasia lichenicola]THG30116.1 site-specific integrase [Naasia lichenicola]
MGTISSYATTAGKRYRVRYRKPDHSQTDKRGFRTKREAEIFLASTEVTKATGQYIDASESRVTIDALGVVWMASQQHLKPSSQAVIEVAWRIHVQPVWGNRRLGDIKHSEVQTWVSNLAARRSASVTIRAFGVLAGIIDVAVRDRRLPFNPARGANLPRKSGKERHYLSHEQVQLLADESRDNGTLILFLAYTGLRWGEAVGLRVKSLDLRRRRVLVQANAVNVRGTIIPGTPKSHEARSVPFPAFLAEPLALLAAGKGRNHLLFGDGEEYQPTPTPRDGWFAGARKRSCLQDLTFPEMLTLHDLRHTAASLAISAGANVKAVQRMLGHASAAMTLDTYADLFDDDLDAVAAALDIAKLGLARHPARTAE